jgi:hypothetical protein
MGGGPTGGDPATIEAGASALHPVVGAVAADATGITSACGSGSAAGNANLEASIARFSAAWSQMASDISAQLAAAALLAQSGAQDLNTATGGH